MTIFFAILLFSFLIFIHELGHFLAAKASGVRVNEFAMFMGPAIIKWGKGETKYSIRCIPIGGYCAMEGEDANSDNPRAFSKASWWKRLLILVAGAAMNFVAGLLILAILFAPAQQVASLRIESFESWSTLDDGGLRVGDEIIRIDGEKMYVFNDFSLILSLNPGDHHDISVLRDGQIVNFRDYKMETHTVTLEDGSQAQKYGVSFGYETLTFAGRGRLVLNTIMNWIRTVRISIQMLISGQAGIQDMSGPVGIVQMMGQQASSAATWQEAALDMIYFGAFLAINLAVMNLLPIPALDGGRVVALLLTTAIEAITHKKLDPKYEGYIHAVGMVLLLGLMAIIMFKDIIYIFR